MYLENFNTNSQLICLHFASIIYARYCAKHLTHYLILALHIQQENIDVIINFFFLVEEIESRRSR